MINKIPEFRMLDFEIAYIDSYGTIQYKTIYKEINMQQDYFDSEPVWVASVISRLKEAGYTVTCKYDGDGDNWKNKKYTVTKGIITYLLDGRAQELMRIAIN